MPLASILYAAEGEDPGPLFGFACALLILAAIVLALLYRRKKAAAREAKEWQLLAGFITGTVIIPQPDGQFRVDATYSYKASDRHEGIDTTLFPSRLEAEEHAAFLADQLLLIHCNPADETQSEIYQGKPR